MKIDPFERACIDLRQALNQTTHMPYLTMSLAMTMNGIVSSLEGTPLKISSALSDRFVHFARSEHDAIVVSANTVQSDNPLLNVRYTQGRSPDVVILDRTLKTPPSSKLFDIESRNVHILTEMNQIQFSGANVHNICSHHNQIDLTSVHSWANEMGYRSMFIEAGPRLFKSFLSYGVDRLVLSIAPTFEIGLSIHVGPDQVSLTKLGYVREAIYPLGEDLLVIYKSKKRYDDPS